VCVFVCVCVTVCAWVMWKIWDIVWVWCDQEWGKGQGCWGCGGGRSLGAGGTVGGREGRWRESDRRGKGGGAEGLKRESLQVDTHGPTPTWPEGAHEPSK